LKHNRESVLPNFDYEIGYSWVDSSIRRGGAGYYYKLIRKICDDCINNKKSIWGATIKSEPVTARVSERCGGEIIKETDKLVYYTLVNK